MRTRVRSLRREGEGRRHRARAWPLALLCASALVLGCAPAREAPLRLGISSWPGFEFLYLAAEKGWFAEAGVPVRIVEFGSLGDTRLAFERGQLDGMASTLIEVVAAADHTGRELTIVLATDYSNGSDVIVAAPGVDSIADLRGRAVAAEPGSLGVYMLARALADAGLTLDDVRLTYLDQLQMRTAVAEGRVAAAVSYPPVSIALQQQPGARVLFSSADIPGEVIDVVSLDSEIVRQRPQVVKALRRAWSRALAYTDAVPAVALAIMAEREGLSAVEFSTALRGVRVLDLAAQERLLQADGSLWRTLQRTAQVMRDAGEVERVPDPRRFALAVP